MIIGARLRALREKKGYSHFDLEEKSGLCRCEISRIEAGETTPDIATLEKLATALESPRHRFFFGGEEPPELLHQESTANRVIPTIQQTPEVFDAARVTADAAKVVITRSL